jgi:hypothetical protein
MRITSLFVLLLLALTARAQTTVSGFTPGSFRVTESGAAEYRIPIRVPPGIAGLEPRLALSYNSHAGNGALGVGWSLEGLSTIQRCPRSKSQDGSRGGIDYHWSDRFCLDGQRLVLVSGTYGGHGAEYRTERESQTKVISYGTAGNGPEWFKVWSKSGQVMEYGKTGDSRIEAQGKQPTVRVWALNQLADTRDNYANFAYTENSADGEYTVSRIDYTGTASNGPTRSVRFSYQSRPDLIVLRSRGSLIKTQSRLAAIKTYIADTAIKEYRLAYSQGSGTLRSRLMSVTECTGDAASCLPATTFGWQDNNANFLGVHAAQPGTDWVSWPGARPIAGDFNGDGKIDLAISAYGLGGIGTYLSNGNSSFTPVHSGQPGTDWVSWPSAKPLAGDFNGDGLTDIAVCNPDSDGIAVYLSAGNGGFHPVWYTYPGWCGWPSARPVTGDFNGDGLTDIAVSADGLGGFGVYLSNGNGTFGTVWSGQTGTDWASWSSAKPIAGDFNGDGITDIAACVQGGGGIGVYLAGGTGGFSGMWSGQPGTDWCSWPSARPIPGDFNGDGLTDIAFSGDGVGGLGVYLAAGDGSFIPLFLPQPGTDWISWPGARPLSGDFNGDGLSDIAVSAYGLGGIALYLSNGDGTFRAGHYGQPGTDWASWPGARPLSADFVGNGKSGILISAYGLDGIASYGPDSALPDLVTSINHGPGLVASIAYHPGTSGLVHTKSAGASFPVIETQTPMHLVSSAATSNGIGGTTTSTYRYTGARSHAHAGTSLGFGKVEATDARGIKTATSFRQDYPYQGLPAQTVSTQPPPSNAVISQVDNTWTDTPLVPAGGGGSYHKSALTQSVERSYELDGGLVTTVTTVTAYDAYGNPTSVTVGTGDGHSKATTNTFMNEATHWRLGRLTRSTVQSPAQSPEP